MCGSSGSSAVSEQQFVEFMRRHLALDPVEELTEVWKLTRPKGSNFVTATDLKVLMRKLGEGFSDARAYGWNVPEPGSENAIKHDWPNMVNAIQDHIGSLNWGYKTALRDNGVTYINAKGKLLDAHTIECTK